MHTYKEYNEPIQKLIEIMQDDYPNGFELHINSFSAELINNQTVRCFTNEEALKRSCDNAMKNFFENINENTNKVKD